MNSPKRVIYCDFDGVLNDPKYLMSTKYHDLEDALDPYRISLLAELCRRTKAKVVLTSTWRDSIEARKKLKRLGVPVIGATPHGKDRGQEIHQWMLDKQFTGDFVILDDEASEYTDYHLKRLVYTREGSNLGLTPKHVLFAETLFLERNPGSWADHDFIRAILGAIREEWHRVNGNVYQRDDLDDEDPFMNTGNVSGFSTEVFEVHAYDWNWDFDDDLKKPQPVNFKWHDLEITWYKWYGRGIYTSRPVTHDELALMLNECLESLRKWEEEYEQN